MAEHTAKLVVGMLLFNLIFSMAIFTATDDSILTTKQQAISAQVTNNQIIRDSFGRINDDGTTNIEGVLNPTGVDNFAYADSRINIGNMFSNIFTLIQNAIIPSATILKLAELATTANNAVETILFIMLGFILGALNVALWIRMYDKLRAIVGN